MDVEEAFLCGTINGHVHSLMKMNGAKQGTWMGRLTKALYGPGDAQEV